MRAKTYKVINTFTDTALTEIKPFISEKLTQILFESASFKYRNHDQFSSRGNIQLIFYKKSHIRLIDIIPRATEDMYFSDIGNFEISVINKLHQTNFNSREERIHYNKNMGYLKGGLGLSDLSFVLDRVCVYGFETLKDFDHETFKSYCNIEDAPYKSFELKSIEHISLISKDDKVIRIKSEVPKTSAQIQITTLEEENKRLAEYYHWQYGPLLLRYEIK